MHLERVHLDGADIVHVAQNVNIWVAVGVLDGSVVVLPPLRVVVRHRADERQLHLGESPLHDAVGVDHAERILPWVEPRDLGQKRPLDVDAELVDDVGGVLGGERHVLWHQRIDRGRPDHDLLQAACGRRVGAHVEDRRVVLANRRQQHVEDILVRGREVDVAAPDPFRPPCGERVDHRNGLRVVDDHEVVRVRVEDGRVLGVVPREDLAVVRRQPAGVALQAVVDRLRDVVELVGAADHPPLDVEARIGHQRHERVVDLGDAAAECGRRHVHDALSAQRLRKARDLVHEAAGDERRVVGERLVADVDELEQG